MNSHFSLIIILGLISLFSAVCGSYQIFYFGLGLALLVWWGLKDSSRKIGIKEDLSGSTGFAGTELCLRLQLSNPSWFPIFWCTLSRTFSPELGAASWQKLTSIRPHGNETMQMTFSPERRGIYNVPDLIVTVGDPFGWNENRTHIASSEKIIVYPPLYSVEGLQLNRHLPWGATKLQFGLHEDPSRLRGCRDYYPGDSLKKIHWPSLARTGLLKVKEWETTLAADIGVFLNLAEADFPVNDWFWLSEAGIDFAASVIQRLIGHKEILGFYCNGKLAGVASETLFKFAPKSGYTQGKRILTFLAGVAVHESQSFSLLFREAYRLKNGSCLLFITPQISVGMVKRARNLKQAGYHPVFLWLQPSRAALPPVELEQARIPCFTVTKGRDNHAFRITRSK